METRVKDVLQDLPKTEFEFERRFRTDEDCIEYLRRRRWPNGFVCPKCGGTRSWKIRTRALDECASCGHQVSITAGTVFENTRKSLVLWFRVIRDFVVSKRGCSAKEIQRKYGLTYRTAWTWLHKIRSCLDRHAVRPLGGIVEVGDTSVGGTEDVRSGGDEPRTGQCRVIAAVEDKGSRMGRLRLAHVESDAGRELREFLDANVQQDSSIAFNELDLGREAGGGENREGAPETSKGGYRIANKVNRVFTLLQRVLLGTYQGAVSPKHLRYYLDEFVFRFNRRTSGSRYLLVERVLGEVYQSPPTYSAIVGRRSRTVPAA